MQLQPHQIDGRRSRTQCLGCTSKYVYNYKGRHEKNVIRPLVLRRLVLEAMQLPSAHRYSQSGFVLDKDAVEELFETGADIVGGQNIL